MKEEISYYEILPYGCKQKFKQFFKKDTMKTSQYS